MGASPQREGAADVTGHVTNVRSAHRFDEGALEHWLRGRLEGAEHGVRIRQFEGGQSNPTFLLETDRGRWVLRKKPSGPLLVSAHMIEREQKVLRALAGSGVPVPAVPLFCEDESVIGTPFFVMSYVHGRILRDPSLPEWNRDDRTAIYAAAVETMAKLHDVDWNARGLYDFGKHFGFLDRQIARWSTQYRDARGREIPAMDWLVTELPRRKPTSSAVSVVHGDYRLENLVVDPSEPRVLAVLDWELSTLGDPLTDLAYFCIGHRVPKADRGLRGLVGHDLEALGIPNEWQIVARYCKLRSIPEPSRVDFAFYLSFSLFRMAAILAGIDGRMRQGNASSENARDMAAQTELFAEAAKAALEEGGGR